MKRLRERLRQGDDASGFTLVELLIASIIVGIVVSSIGAAMLIGLKTVFATGERLSLSANSQQLATFFNTDVQSANPSSTGIVTAEGASGCSGADTGSRVLRVAGTNADGSSFVADYRRVGTVLERNACAPGGVRSITAMVRDVVTIPTPVIAGRTVKMTVTVDDITESNDEPPYTFTLTASRRTPSPDCEALLGNLVVSPVSVALNGTTLVSPLTVTFTTAGGCTSALVTYQFGVGSTDSVAASTSGGGNWTATIPAGANSWTPGDKSVTVTSGSESVSSTFSVFNPATCQLGAGGGSPTVAPVTKEQSGGVLVAPLTVTFTTVGACPGSGNVTYQYGDDLSLVNTVAATKSGDTWTATIPMAVPATAPLPAAWTSGTKQFTFAGDVAAGSGSFAVTTAVACSVVAGSLSPNPATGILVTSGPNTGQLTADASVSFQTLGSCPSPTLTYQYAGAGLSGTVSASGTASPGTWTALIPRQAPGSWTAGIKPLTVTAGTATGSIGQLTVTAPPCVAITSVTTAPFVLSKKQNGTPDGDLTNPVQVTVQTSPTCSATPAPTLTFTYENSTTTRTATLSSGAATASGTPWTATLPADLGANRDWTAGPKTITVTHGSGVATSSQFEVVP